MIYCARDQKGTDVSSPQKYIEAAGFVLLFFFLRKKEAMFSALVILQNTYYCALMRRYPSNLSQSDVWSSHYQGSLSEGRALTPELLRSPAGDTAAIIIMVWRGQARGTAICRAPGNAPAAGDHRSSPGCLSRSCILQTLPNIKAYGALMNLVGEIVCCFEARWDLWALDL